jgi:hypothetical protein
MIISNVGGGLSWHICIREAIKKVWYVKFYFSGRQVLKCLKNEFP